MDAFQTYEVSPQPLRLGLGMVFEITAAQYAARKSQVTVISEVGELLRCSSNSQVDFKVGEQLGLPGIPWDSAPVTDQLTPPPAPVPDDLLETE